MALWFKQENIQEKKSDIYDVLEKAKFVPTYGQCVGNGLIASLLYFQSTGKTSELYNVVFPQARTSQTYWVSGGEAFSKDVTWPNAEFPELSLSEIKKMQNTGDISTQLSLYAWMNSTRQDIFLPITNKYRNKIARPAANIRVNEDVSNPEEIVRSWQQKMLKYALACAIRDGHGDEMMRIMKENNISI